MDRDAEALRGRAAVGIDHLQRHALAADLVARRRDRLDDLAERLGSNGSTVEVLACDLTDPTGLAKIEARASQGDIEFLVNNAGFAGYRPFAELDPKIAEDLIRLHVLAVTRLTRAALPGMLERGSGAIVNVASLLSLSGSLPANPLPYRATYAGAKAFIVTFTQALSGELPASGVRLQALLPGVVATEFHDTLNVDRSRMASMAMQMPRRLVAKPGASRTTTTSLPIRAPTALAATRMTITCKSRTLSGFRRFSCSTLA